MLYSSPLSIFHWCKELGSDSYCERLAMFRGNIRFYSRLELRALGSGGRGDIDVCDGKKKK